MNLEDILSKNASLKNIHAGQRCFIVGNGPSLKLQDITLLQDEISIVANEFHHLPEAKMIKPKYWVLADPHRWRDPENYFLPPLQVVHDLAIYTKLFLPIGGFHYYSTVNSGPLIDMHFFHYDYAKDINKHIDFLGGIPPYGQNVVMVGLMLAFYMGCNPIYFLGCDHDFFKFTQEEYELGIEVKHADSRQSGQSPVTNMPWNEWRSAMEKMDWQYEQLKMYANIWGFDVFNATRGGCLETFPRAVYESLFPKILLKRGASGVDTPPATSLQFVKVAIKLMNDGDAQSALVLLNEGIKQNVHGSEKVEGMDYLKAICLAKLKRIDEALFFSKQDYLCNPANRNKSSLLIEQLERVARD